MSKDAIIISLAVAGLTFLGTTLAFLILWIITMEDRNEYAELYDACVGISDDAAISGQVG